MRVFCWGETATHIEISTQENKVTPSFHSHDRTAFDADFLIQGLHLKTLGYGHSIKPQVLPQQIIDHKIAQARM